MEENRSFVRETGGEDATVGENAAGRGRAVSDTHHPGGQRRETSQVTRGRHTRTEGTRTEETSGQNQINAAALKK